MPPKALPVSNIAPLSAQDIEPAREAPGIALELVFDVAALRLEADAVPALADQEDDHHLALGAKGHQDRVSGHRATP